MRGSRLYRAASASHRLRFLRMCYAVSLRSVWQLCLFVEMLASVCGDALRGSSTYQLIGTQVQEEWKLHRTMWLCPPIPPKEGYTR